MADPLIRYEEAAQRWPGITWDEWREKRRHANRMARKRGEAEPYAPLSRADKERVRQILEGRTAPAPQPVVADKKEGSLDWRAANAVLRDMQELRKEASWSQEQATIDFSQAGDPIHVITLCDTHVLSWGTDHDLFERITDEILATPNLYVAFLGDVAEMAIKLRSVAEVAGGNMLPPEMQLAYVESWFAEIAPRTLFATWDNHTVEREEKQSGISGFASLFSRRVVYHSGIGHPDIRVGGETYRLAASHRFRGSSMDNPCHSGVRYLLREGADREIAMAGDSHRPGMLMLTHSGEPKLALNGGTLHLNSSYAKRYFSLRTSTAFPVFTLYPDIHLFTPYWSLEHLLAAQTSRR